MTKPIDIQNLAPYRFWLIPNYKENESMILFTGHHSAADGIQFFSILQGMTTKKDFSKLPRVTPPTFYQKMVSYLCLPYTILLQGYMFATYPFEYNCIKRDPPKIRRRISRVSKDIPFNLFRKGCKQYKCSFNEAMLSIIGVTLKEYSNNRG